MIRSTCTKRIVKYLNWYLFSKVLQTGIYIYHFSIIINVCKCQFHFICDWSFLEFLCTGKYAFMRNLFDLLTKCSNYILFPLNKITKWLEFQRPSNTYGLHLFKRVCAECALCMFLILCNKCGCVNWERRYSIRWNQHVVYHKTDFLIVCSSINQNEIRRWIDGLISTISMLEFISSW